MKPLVNVPERIAFVNLNTGNVFFDCHPAEARTAINAVNKMRATPDEDIKKRENDAYKVYIDAVLERSKSVEPVVVDVIGKLPTAAFFSWAIRQIEINDMLANTMIMNAVEYDAVRRLADSVYSMETSKAVLETGVFGELYHWTKVNVRRACPPGEIIVATDMDEDKHFAFHRFKLIYRTIQEPIKIVLERLEAVQKEAKELELAVKMMLGPEEGTVRNPETLQKIVDTSTVS